jgi:NADPH:quinone reductase-like Zn-dependent oxidoreductase
MFVRRHTVVCFEPISSFPCRSVLLQDTIHGRVVVNDRERLERAKRLMLDGLASGALKPIIDKTFPLDSMPLRHKWFKHQKHSLIS